MSIISFERFRKKRALQELARSPEFEILEDQLDFAFSESQAFVKKMAENRIENFMLSLDIDGKEFILTLDCRGGGDVHA